MTILGRSRAGLFAGAAALALITAGAAHALPSGGTVVAEQIPGTSITTGSTTVTVHQQGDRVVINWDTFDVASNESVNFNQPSETAITFNRVLAAGPTHIDGQINGYGGVFIFAPGGMLFGPTSQVNVGTLVASSVQLPTSQFSAALNTNSLSLPPPGALNPSNPFPGVTISQGASINAYNGFVALVGPQITVDGSIDAFDSVVYIGAEGGSLSYVVNPGIDCDCGIGGTINLAGFQSNWVVGRGRANVTQGANATITAGAGFGVVIPPPVLEPGFHSTINLAGVIEAEGSFAAGPNSIILAAGPPVAPGWANVTSGLVSPGSLSNQLDTSNASISGVNGLVFGNASGTATFGEMDAAGFTFQAYDDFTFNGDASFTGPVNFSNGGNVIPNGGIGDVTFNARFETDGYIRFLTFGDVTVAPDVTVLGTDELSFNGVVNSTTQGVRSVTIGDGANFGSYGPVLWNNMGDLDVGEGAELHGQQIEIANRGAGGSRFRHDAHVFGGAGVSLYGSGPVTIESGAMVASFYYSGPAPDDWPVTYYSPHFGGVYIQASDLRLDGNIQSSYGEGGSGPVVIDASPLANQMIIGGADAADAPGVFRLSNSEFQRIYGDVSIGASAFVLTNPIPIDVRDLDIDGNLVANLVIYSFADGDITISGNVLPVADTNDVELRIGLWLAREGFQQPDTWRSLIPRDILITGSLGSIDRPFDGVLMAAQRDILIGTPSYVGAAQVQPGFDPQFPQQVETPAVDRLFVVADNWSMFASGRVFQQNTALSGGHSGFAVNEPSQNFELFPFRDFSELLDGFEISFDFGSNPPVFPDYSDGPAAISLHGVMFQDGPPITGVAVAEHPNNLADEFETGPTYFINDCQIGGCETLSQGGAVVAATPTPGYQYAAIVARRPGETIINQVADRVIIDWQDFQVGSDEEMVFNQPGSASMTLNRQQGGTSFLSGQVLGDAGVFLFSPQGIVVEDGATIDVGALVLSSVQLQHSEFNAALTSNVINLLNPTELDEDNPFPAVEIESGAQLNTNHGFVALVGPDIRMDGDIDASDSILNLVGEGGTLFFNTGPTGFTNLNAGVGYVFGRSEIAFSQSGSATSGAGYSLITPPPVLADGQDFTMHVGGQIHAGGSVFLYTGGAQRPGFNGGVLQHAGSGSISLDTTDATIVAGAGGIGGGSYNAAFGSLTTSGLFSFSTVGDIDFYGNLSLGSASFTNGQGLPYSQTGDGDVNFHANVNTTGDFAFGTLGEVNFDPEISLHAGGQFVFGLPSAGTGDVTFGDDVSLTAGTRISWNGNNGDLLIGDSVLINAGTTLGFQAQSVTIGHNATLHAGSRIALTSFGDTVVGQGSDIIGETGVAASNAGRFTLGPGATLQSHNSPEDAYPLVVYGAQLGGVFLQASDVDIQGDIISTRPISGPVGPIFISSESEPGIIILDITQAASSAIVGGADAPNAAGVFRLSAAEYARLHGLVTVSSAPLEDETPVSIEVRGLTLDANQNPYLTIVTFGSADVSITGTIVSANATEPTDTAFRVGEFLILDNPSGQDQWENLIPRDILITGAIGTEAHPVGVVGLIAWRDILIGTPAYIAAVQGDTGFDPLHPPLTIDEPSPGQIFIAANIFEYVANGRVFQQNSGTGFLGSGILIGVPTEETPLTVGFDFQAAFNDLDDDSFNFGSNPPQFPNFSGGPLGISLWGKLVGDGFTIEGSDAAQQDFLLSPNLSIRPHSYYINGCEFGGACANGDVIQETTFRDPTVIGLTDGFDILDQWAAQANNPLTGPNNLLADFIVVPEYDPGADAAGIGQSVTGSGNGDLWITPTEAH